MRRLYLQIYLTFVSILVLFSVLLSVAWLFMPHDEDELRTFEGIEAVVGELLPGPDRSNAELQAVLERLHEKLPLHLAVHGLDGRLLAAVGDRLPRPRRGRTHSSLMRSRRAGATVAVRLPGRRWLVARHGPHDGRFAGGWLGALALLALAIAVGAYPLVRRTTRRLERLQDRVDQLGAGELAARVEVEGNDEVAELARRLDTLDKLEQVEEVDLLALLAEEAAPDDVKVSGDPLRISGDRRMLRRLIRNLLQNSKRYGAGTVEASVNAGEGDAAILRVCDRGPGVPDGERERIFEPFYRIEGDE